VPGAREDDNPVGWSADGRSIYVRGNDGSTPVIARIDLDTGRREELWRLMIDKPAGLQSVGPVLVTPDGRGYVYSYRRLLSTLYVAEGF
jgi:hypothetical protein